MRSSIISYDLLEQHHFSCSGVIILDHRASHNLDDNCSVYAASDPNLMDVSFCYIYTKSGCVLLDHFSLPAIVISLHGGNVNFKIFHIEETTR